MLGLLGKKIGMTRIYDPESGVGTPVTVVDVSDNVVMQIKEQDKDGYAAVQIGYDGLKESRLTYPKAGHFRKNGGKAKRYIKEFRVDEKALADMPKTGSVLAASQFQKGQFIDVIGTTKGKGFQGVVKRYNFGGLPDGHGSMMHRRTGAVGAGTTPGRIWKNQKMPGRHGNYRRTVQNLQIVDIREEDNALLIKGALPGHKQSYLVIRPAKKKSAPASAEKS